MLMRKAQKARSLPASLAAPVGGWNARDALGNMPPLDAVYLTNWYPATTDVRLRNGYTNYSTGLGAQVETLFVYSGGTTDKLFGVTSAGNIYDCTSGGAVGAAVVTGLSNGRWQYTNIATPGGNFLVAFNGTDAGLRYNGTTWVGIPSATGKTISSLTGNGTTSTVTTATAHGLQTGNTITVTGASVAGFNVSNVTITKTGSTTFTYLSAGTPSATGASYTVAEGISGVDPTTIIDVTLFKNRLWLTQVGTLTPYYLGTSSIAGAAVQFPVSAVAQLGGYVMAIGTWTGDGGYGMDDMLAMVTNKGEIIVYNGLDPATASSWQLTGVWQLGAPIGRRCMFKYGGDLLIISQDGVIPMSKALQSARVDPTTSLSNKIQFAVSSAVSTYGANFGWQLTYFAKENQLYLNVPVSTGSQEQYVMNTITGSWCNFTGWAANCWEVFQDNPYFGGNGIVGKAWNGNTDNTSNITADGKQAFNYFGSQGLLKRWTMMRPILSTNGNPGILASVNIDFDDTAPTSPVSYAPSSSGTWDTAVWDTSLWGGGNSIQKQWQGVTGVGYSAAVRLKTVSSGIDVQWISTDLVMERGAIL